MLSSRTQTFAHIHNKRFDLDNCWSPEIKRRIQRNHSPCIDGRTSWTKRTFIVRTSNGRMAHKAAIFQLRLFAFGGVSEFKWRWFFSSDYIGCGFFTSWMMVLVLRWTFFISFYFTEICGGTQQLSISQLWVDGPVGKWNVGWKSFDGCAIVALEASDKYGLCISCLGRSLQQYQRNKPHRQTRERECYADDNDVDGVDGCVDERVTMSHALMGRALEANEIGVSFFFILHPSFLWQTNHAGTILQTEWPEDE